MANIRDFQSSIIDRSTLNLLKLLNNVKSMQIWKIKFIMFLINELGGMTHYGLIVMELCHCYDEESGIIF